MEQESRSRRSRNWCVRNVCVHDGCMTGPSPVRSTRVATPFPVPDAIGPSLSCSIGRTRNCADGGGGEQPQSSKTTLVEGITTCTPKLANWKKLVSAPNRGRILKRCMQKIHVLGRARTKVADPGGALAHTLGQMTQEEKKKQRG